MAVSSTGSFWSWSYRWLEGVWCGCWEPKLGPQQEQYLLLATEPSLSPIIITVNVKDEETIWSSNFTQVVTQKNWGPALQWSPLELRHYCKRLRGEKTPSVYQCVSGYVKYLVWRSITPPSTKETGRLAVRWGNRENTLFRQWCMMTVTDVIDTVVGLGTGSQRRVGKSVTWAWEESTVCLMDRVLKWRQTGGTDWHVRFDVSERTCGHYQNLIYCILIW